MKIARLYPVLLVSSWVFLYGCSFQKIGSDLGKGVSGTTDTIGHTLVAGIRDELTSPVTRKKVSKFLDSILTSVTDTLDVKVKTLEDSMLNRKVLVWADSLVEALTGSQLKLNMANSQAALIGKTKADVIQMRNAFSQLLAEILSDNTRGKLGLIRSELLGPRTSTALAKIIDTAVSHIVDSAMIKISQRLRTDINPQLREDVSFIQKNASWLLLTIGAIAAAIIFLVWKNKQKYLRMVAIITKHIHDIPDQHVYDLVTSRIKKDTVTAGLEPDLRNILNKNGLIGTGSWKKGDG